ncbi:MAG: T9SS type A sorting domain-containing protein [bacterium]
MKSLYRHLFLLVIFSIIFNGAVSAQFNQTNLKMWLSADELSSSLSDGDKVAQWSDLSGSGNIAEQPFSTDFQPVYNATGMCNGPAVYFNGINNYMLLHSPEYMGIRNNEYEIFIVAQSSSAANQFLISADAGNYELQLNPSTDAGLKFYPVTGQTVDAGSANGYTDNLPHIFSIRAGASDGVIRVDKSDCGNSGSSALNNGSFGFIELGGRATGSNWFAGYISEVLIFNTVLSPSDRADVESYLWAKYPDYKVTSTDDDNLGTGRYGTLRYAMNEINTSEPTRSASIDLTSVSGTITLTSSLPPINYSTIITGPGENSLAISGNDLYRPFFIGSGTAPFSASFPATPEVLISYLTISHGKAKGGNGGSDGGGAAGMGGAIFINYGTLNIDHVNFIDNSAIGGNTTYQANSFAGGGGGFDGDGQDYKGSTGDLYGGNGGSSGLLGGTEGIGTRLDNGGNGGIGGGGGGATDPFYNVTRYGGNGGFAGGGGAIQNCLGTAYGGNGGFGGGGGGGVNGGTTIPGAGGFGGGNAVERAEMTPCGGGGAGMGGAIFNYNGILIITNSDFSSNTTVGGIGGNNGSTYGGAVFNYGGSYSLTNVTYGTGANANSADNDADVYIYGGSITTPTISSIYATNVTGTTAVLNSYINSNGVNVTYYFIYGTDPDNLTGITSTVSDNGTLTKNISRSITGLTPGNFYYFKLVAEYNSSQTLSSLGIFEYQNSIPTANLKMWLSADKGVITSGSGVTQWCDRSGNGKNGTQPADIAKPTLVTGVINGKPIIRFTSPQNLFIPIAASVGIANSDYEIFIIAKSSSSSRQFLISFGDGIGPELQINAWGFGASLISNNFDDCNSGSTGSYSDGTAHLISGVVNSSGSILRIDGDNLASSSSNFITAGLSGARIGMRQSGVFPFEGDIAEIIIYSSVLSAENREIVERYLDEKYDISTGMLGGPTVTATSISNHTSTTARLNGAVNPNGFATTYIFRYGTNIGNLNQTTTIQDAGSGSSAIDISADVSGLTAGVKYYNQVSATSTYGTKTSNISGFIYPVIPTENLRLWLDASNGTSSTSTGASISQWNDQSGNGFSATQSTGSIQPTYQLSSMDYCPAVRLASSQYFTIPTAATIGIANSEFEIFIVAKSSYSERQFLISFGEGIGPDIQINGWGYGMGFISNNNDCSQGVSGNYSDGVPHVFSVRANSSGAMTRVDGVDGSGSLLSFITPGQDKARIGIRVGTYMPFYGDISEILVYNKYLDADKRNEVENYLGAKYKIASGSLPVELTAFEAKLDGKNVKLNWSTATEVNNYGFEIERKIPLNPPPSKKCRTGLIKGDAASAEGDWETIGFVEGNGNSNSPKEYSFTDNEITAGKYSYRLKQIDTDGSFTYSKIVIVETRRGESLPAEFALYQNYPNPFNPSTTIKYSIPAVETPYMASLRVYDILGNEVATLVNETKEPGVYEVEFDGSNLASGIYFYQLNAGSFTATKKLILLK